jgi:hypothetical protein
MVFYGKDASGNSTGSQTLWIPYAGVAVVVVILAVVFYFADVPDIKTKDDYHLDETTPGTSHSIWSHPHFVLAVAAQFLYVAAQSGIFSFFINYMTSQVPPIPASWNSGLLRGWFEAKNAGVLQAGLAFGGVCVPELLFHVHYVSDDFCAGHFWFGLASQKGFGVHRDGDHGRCGPAEAYGLHRRQDRYLPGIHRAFGLLRVRQLLRIQLAKAQPLGGVAWIAHLGWTLTVFDLWARIWP